VFDVPRAEAGSSYRGAIRITHGCSGSPVREVIVEIPDGVRGAKPMPKPGWTLSVEKARLAKPYESHGRRIEEDVVRVRWSGGRLESSHFDEFVLLAGLPKMPGTLYWKVSQVCEQGRIDWFDIPQGGRPLSDYKTPAAPLEVLPAAHSEHKH
jgi:uncharacterized protein YcnI